MKQILPAFLALLLVLCVLGACGENSLPSSKNAPGQGSLSNVAETPEPTEPAGEESSAGQEVSDQSADGVWEEMILIEVRETGLTAVAEEYGSLLTFGTPESIAFEPGLEDELKPGMTVSVHYDGAVLETYPGQIHADALQVTGWDDGLIALYLDVLEDLYGEDDDGLNDNCRYFGFDLSGPEELSQKELEAIGWVFASAHQCEPLYGTIRELGDQGYINMEELYWKDGVHFELKTADETETSFTLDVTKWRSGLGAIGYRLNVEKRDGLWTAGEAGMGWES